MPNNNNRNPLSNWPGMTNSGINPVTGLQEWLINSNFCGVQDFTNKEGNPDPIMYFILANDMLTLRDTVFSVEETMGSNPGATLVAGVTTKTIGERIDNLEDGTVFDTRYDARHGGTPATSVNGVTWAAVYTAVPASRQALTILGHVHNGVYNAKISLTSHVSGLLPVANINLTQLTGDVIYSNAARTVLISTELGHCLRDNVSDEQAIVGPIDVGGNVNTQMIHEYNIVDSLVAGISATADNAAWTGFSLQSGTATVNGSLYAKSMKLRYWRYSLGIRSAVSSVGNVGQIAVVRVKNLATGVTIKTFSIDPTMYRTTGYEVVYTDFVFNGTRPQDSIQVTIDWAGSGKGVTMKLDSISIVPVHLSAYNI